MWFSFLLELFSGIDNFWNCILVQMPRYRIFHSISSVFFAYWGKINFLIKKSTQIGQQWLGNFVMEQRWNYTNFFLSKNVLKLTSFNLFLQQSQLRCLGIKKEVNLEKLERNRIITMLTLQWSFPQVSWNFVLKSIYIDFFQLAIVKLYRMLDQAEVIIISESQMCMFIKRAAEVEIQKTQCGTVQKVINMFELLLLATISFSTNM